jgi:hypothetical protein
LHVLLGKVSAQQSALAHAGPRLQIVEHFLNTH